jgi:hypothetical protein
MENKEFLRKIVPYGKIVLCVGLCCATAKTVASICDDDEVRRITKKLRSAAEIVKYMTGVTSIVNGD